MMAAMMLPSVTPVASLYARSISGRRALRLTLFTVGYLVVWASAGVIAFALGSFIAGLAEGDPRLGTAAGVAAYLACGLYQLSPLKYRCLAHCRSPLSLFFHYNLFPGASARPPGRRASRPLLSGLLLGADGRPARPGRDERRPEPDETPLGLRANGYDRR